MTLTITRPCSINPTVNHPKVSAVVVLVMTTPEAKRKTLVSLPKSTEDLSPKKLSDATSVTLWFTETPLNGLMPIHGKTVTGKLTGL
jgi:hypothetical protein